MRSYKRLLGLRAKGWFGGKQRATNSSAGVVEPVCAALVCKMAVVLRLVAAGWTLGAFEVFTEEKKRRERWVRKVVVNLETFEVS